MKSIVKRIVLLAIAVFALTAMFSYAENAEAKEKNSKKGIQVGSYFQAVDENAENAFFNLDLSGIVVTYKTSQKLYKVDGKQYYLDAGRLEDIRSNSIRYRDTYYPNGKLFVKILVSSPIKGLSFTKNEGTVYYGLNTKTYLSNVDLVFKHLANYLGEGIDYWIIGNEIDAYKTYNNMGNISVNTYAEYYARAMISLKNNMLPKNKNAAFLIPFDQGWTHVDSGHYSSKVLLNLLADHAKAAGDFNWGIALQPYPNPVDDPVFWDDAAPYITHDENTDMITMYNVEVFTDYMQQSKFLYKGKVRPMCLTEYGMNAFRGTGGKYDPTTQAAAFIYSYYKLDANPYIQYIIYNALNDDWDGYNFGLTYQNSKGKLVSRKIRNLFRYIDTEKGPSYTKEYKKYFGIKYWDEIISVRDAGYPKNFTGYCKIGTTILYAKNGQRYTKHTGLFKRAGKYEYYLKGRKNSKTGLAYFKGDGIEDLRYVKKGIYNTSFKGYASLSGKTYYIENGKAVLNYNGFHTSATSGKTFYFRKGVCDRSYKSLVKRSGKYVYVNNGVLDLTYTGFVKRLENGNTYYVKNGVWQKGYKNIIKGGSKYYYVVNGRRDLTYNGLAKRLENGNTYLMTNGVWNKNFNGLYKNPANASLYYILEGRWQSGFTGKVVIDKKKYQIRNGIVEESLNLAKESDSTESETQEVIPETEESKMPSSEATTEAVPESSSVPTSETTTTASEPEMSQSETSEEENTESEELIVETPEDL